MPRARLPRTADLEVGDTATVNGHLYLVCCDCKLRHHIIVRPVADGAVEMTFYRDEWGTRVLRGRGARPKDKRRKK